MPHEEDEHSRSNGSRTGSGRRSGVDRPDAASHSGPGNPNSSNNIDEPRLDSDRQFDDSGDVGRPSGLSHPDDNDELDTAHLAEAVEDLGPKLAKSFTQSVQIEARQGWSAPMPRPADLAAYESTLPGAADRILAMAEKALDSQIATDATLSEGDVSAITRGQWLFAVVACVSLVLGFTALILDVNPWASAAIASPAVLQFAGALVRNVREPNTTKHPDNDRQPPALPTGADRDDETS